MKLTPEKKSEIDNLSVGVIAGRLRFFQSIECTGESGKYMREVLQDKISKEKDSKTTLKAK